MKFSRMQIEFVEDEMKNLLLEKPLASHRFIIHYLSSSALMEEIPLQAATDTCPDRPIIVLGLTDGTVKARCTVPKHYISNLFNASSWLREFASVFRGKIVAPRGRHSVEVCYMKARRLNSRVDERLELAMRIADDFAMKYFR